MTGDVKGTVCPEAGNRAGEERDRGEELKPGITQGIWQPPEESSRERQGQVCFYVHQPLQITVQPA